MARPIIAEPVDLLSDKTKLEALRELLRLNAAIWLPADGLGDTAAPATWCMELETAIGNGCRVSHYGRSVMVGPHRFFGRERLLVELR